MGISLPDTALERLAAYIRLLARWNQAYNLTAVRRPEAMVSRHILDSLAILPWVRGPRVLDVGSGAGLPGIPLAIARPEVEFYLLDSSAKRVRFMIQAVAELALANVNVVRCRVEDYSSDVPFDCIITRAFASLAFLLVSAGRLCAPNGCLLAMKGRRPDDELKHLPTGYSVVGVYPLRVPELDAARHLVHLVPVES
jgi:16S rRNA (guanine527-N7)-methyltransferase